MALHTALLRRQRQRRQLCVARVCMQQQPQLQLQRRGMFTVSTSLLSTTTPSPSTSPSWSSNSSWPALLLSSLYWTAVFAAVVGVVNVLTRGNVRGELRPGIEPVVPAKLLLRGRAVVSLPSDYGFVGDDTAGDARSSKTIA